MLRRNFIKRLAFSLLITFAFLIFTSKIEAATTGSFSIVKSGDLIQSCNSSVDIMVDTGGESSNSADIIINYNPSEIEILDGDSVKPGKQLKVGNAYESYFGNQINESTGLIRLTGASFESEFKGNGVFATILFKSKPSVTSTSFNIKFDGASSTNTKDSNIAIASSGLDALGSVNSASLQFISGSCALDKTPPTISFSDPVNNQLDVAEDTVVRFTLSDSESKVDISTLQVLINGVLYDSKNSLVNASGNSSNYSVSISQNSILKDNTSTISVKVADFNGNIGSESITFNLNKSPIIKEMIEKGLICKPEDIPSPQETTEDVPFTSYVNQLQKNFENTPVRAVVKETGIFGLASIIATLPIIIWFFSIFLSFFAGGFLMPFLRAVFSKYKNVEFGQIIDELSKEKLSFATILVTDKKSNLVINKLVSNIRGKYFLYLEVGEYTLEISKRNYRTKTLGITVADRPGPASVTIELAKLEEKDVAAQLQFRVFKLDPKILSIYIATCLSIINIVYYRTVVAYAIFVVLIVMSIVVSQRKKLLLYLKK